jgi:hypothetical protein
MRLTGSWDTWLELAHRLGLIDDSAPPETRACIECKLQDLGAFAIVELGSQDEAQQLARAHEVLSREIPVRLERLVAGWRPVGEGLD